MEPFTCVIVSPHFSFFILHFVSMSRLYIRCSIGRQLYVWLVEADHLEILQKCMTAAEHSVLICKFVAEESEEAMAKDPRSC